MECGLQVSYVTEVPESRYRLIYSVLFVKLVKLIYIIAPLREPNTDP